MHYPWVNDYLMAMPCVTSNVQTSWNWVRYYVGGKMFAAVCLNGENKPYYITVKLPPPEGELLRSQFEDVIPGYYCNKLHWNSIRACGSVPEDVVRTMLEHAWRTGLEALPKKKQRDILAMQANPEGGETP